MQLSEDCCARRMRSTTCASVSAAIARRCGIAATLVAEQAQREAEAAALLRRVRPDLTLDATPADADRLRPLLTRRRRATDLGARREALVAAVVKTRADLAETQDRLRRKTAALAEQPPPVSSIELERVLDAARRAGDLDGGIAEMRVTLANATKGCEKGLAALGLWSGVLVDLPAAPFPDEASVRRFADEARALKERREALDLKLVQDRAEQAGCEEDLRALELIGSVPSEDDLLQVRGHRDQGWQLVKKAWLEGADVSLSTWQGEPGAPLEDAFEDAMIGADEVADRLRREAQHVHERATARARHEVCAQRIAECERGMADLDRLAAEWQTAWSALWSPCGSDPAAARGDAALAQSRLAAVRDHPSDRRVEDAHRDAGGDSPDALRGTPRGARRGHRPERHA
jgi:hypothetical protein